MNLNVKKTAVLSSFVALVALAGAAVFATWSATDKWTGYRCTPQHGYGTFGYGYGYGYGGFDCVKRSSSSSTSGVGSSSPVPANTGSLTTGEVNTGVKKPDVILTGVDFSGYNLSGLVIPQVAEFVKTTEGQAALDSIKTSPYATEWNNAYLFARSLGITTMPTIQSAQFERNITRAELAKMISVYAQKVMNKTPNTGNVACANFADKGEVNAELQGFMQLACELEVMGLKNDGKTPLVSFMPNKTVSRAEMATVFSRLLFGAQFDNVEPYWTNHMSNLNKIGIINVTTPTLIEERVNVFLMMYRSAGK